MAAILTEHGPLNPALRDVALGATRNSVKCPQDALRTARKLAALKQSGPFFLRCTQWALRRSCSRGADRLPAQGLVVPAICLRNIVSKRFRKAYAMR